MWGHACGLLPKGNIRKMDVYSAAASSSTSRTLNVCENCYCDIIVSEDLIAAPGRCSSSSTRQQIARCRGGPGKKREAGICYCDENLHCSAVYCSESCRSSDQISKHWLLCKSSMQLAYQQRTEAQEAAVPGSGATWSIAAATLAVLLSRVSSNLHEKVGPGQQELKLNLDSESGTESEALKEQYAFQALDAEWQKLMTSLNGASFGSNNGESKIDISVPDPEQKYVTSLNDDEGDGEEDDSWAILVQGLLLTEKIDMMCRALRGVTSRFFTFARWCGFWKCIRRHVILVYRDSPLLTTARGLLTTTSDDREQICADLTLCLGGSSAMSTHVNTSHSLKSMSLSEDDPNLSHTLEAIRRERQCLELAQAATDGRLAAFAGQTELAVLILNLPRHSCAPTHALEIASATGIKTETYAPCKIAMHTIGGGNTRNELEITNSTTTICWETHCDCTSDYSERSRLLVRRFGAHYVCSCDLCVYEKWQQHEQQRIRGGIFRSLSKELELSPPTSIRDLKLVAYSYMRALKFTQASRILKYQVQRQPSDGDAWHALGAALLSSSAKKWPAAHAVWRQGVLACPDHELLKHTINKIDIYACAVRTASATVYSNKQVSKAIQAPVVTFALDGLVGMTTEAIVDANQCRSAINAAKAHAAETGWTTTRHYAVPTTDIPFHESLQLRSWLADVLLPKVLPMLSSMFFQGKEMQCSIHDAFVVKYEADAGQRCLPLHTDESTHSLTVALNANTDYEGGGTYFHALKSAARPNQGQVLAFDGSLLHAGDSVLTGTRYIVAAFLLLASMDEPIAQEWMDLFGTDVEKQCSVSKKPRLEVEKSCSDSGSFDFCL